MSKKRNLQYVMKTFLICCWAAVGLSVPGLAEQDAVLLITNHSTINYEKLAEQQHQLRDSTEEHGNAPDRHGHA